MITSTPSSRRSTVRVRATSLAVLAVGAVLLADCAVLGGGEEPADALLVTAAGVAHERRAGSDPVDPVYDPGPALDLSAEPDTAVADEGVLPAWSAWTLEVPEAFATLASSQCEYCLFRLAAATAIHDGGGELPQPWLVEVDDAVAMGEVTGPEYVAVEFTGVDHGLAYRTPGSGADSLIGLPGEFAWRVDMMYSDGRWWVIEVYAL